MVYFRHNGIRPEVIVTKETSALIKQHTPLAFWQEIVGQVEALFPAAHKLAKGTGLIARRARHVEGQYRFAAIEQAFETIGERHGAANLYKMSVPGSDEIVFQPYQRFGPVVVGFAMQAEPGALPSANRSRMSAVQLNLPLEPTLPFSIEPPEKTVFVALCASRKRDEPGCVRGIELLVIDSRYDQFLFRQSVTDFMAGYTTHTVIGSAPPSAGVDAAPSVETPKPLVRLKPRPAPVAAAAPTGKKPS